MSNNSFNNYDNSIDVLNEGFFDFVAKWVKRLLHSLFKADSFSSLYKRLSQLENLIKYGETMNESKSAAKIVKLNERRSIYKRINEDDVDSSKGSVTNASDSSVSDASISSDDIEDPNEIDLDNDNNIQPTVNMDKINMNIPSFPQVAKQLLNNLKDQMDRNEKHLSVDRLKEDLEAVQNGKQLSQRYVQTLEILVTDFIRKYSAGSLILPRPEKDKTLSRREIDAWLKYSENAKSNSSDKMFKYVHDAMEKIVNDYEKSFIEEYNNLKDDENSFIKKYKDDDLNKNDRNFLSEWETKIMTKLTTIKNSCIEYIPTAITDYFITNKVYKNASDYIQLALQLLVANSKNIASTNKNIKNDLLYYVNEYVNGNEDDINDIIDKEKNEILSKINGNKTYKVLEDHLNDINDDIIKQAIRRINNIKNIQRMTNRDLLLIDEKTLSSTIENETIRLIIALLIHSINNNFKFEVKNVGDIFNLNIQPNNN